MHLTCAQWSWICYDMANAAFALIVRTVYAPLFFKDYSAAGMNPALATGIWGYVGSGAGLAAGILAPWLGSIADANAWRKRFLALFLGIGVAATLAICLTGRSNAGWMLSFYFTALVSYMACGSFYDALLPDIASRGSAADRLSSLAYAWGYVGGVIPFLVCLAVSLLLKDAPIAAIRFAFAAAAFWWIALAIPMFRFVKERNRPDLRHVGALDGFRRLLRTFREIRRHRDAGLFLVSYFLYIDGVGTILMMAAPISVDIGIPREWLLVTILSLQFLAFPFTILYGILASRYGVRKMLYVAIGAYLLISALVGLIPLFDAPGAKRALFLSSAFLIGTSQGGIQSLSRSFFTRLIPSGQSAEFFGFYNIFGKFTTILGPLLVGVAGWLFGSGEIGIALLGIPFLLGGFLLGKVRLPSEKKGAAHD